jgi:hypothetical protein
VSVGGGQNDSGARFLIMLLFLLPILIPPNAPCLLSGTVTPRCLLTAILVT